MLIKYQTTCENDKPGITVALRHLADWLDTQGPIEQVEVFITGNIDGGTDVHCDYVVETGAQRSPQYWTADEIYGMDSKSELYSRVVER